MNLVRRIGAMALNVRVYILQVCVFCVFCLASCTHSISSHEQMLDILKRVKQEEFTPKNSFCPDARLLYIDSLLNVPHSSPSEILYSKYMKAGILLELGREAEAVAILEALLAEAESNRALQHHVMKELALAYLRQGERANCIHGHAAESCILPIKGLGVHADPLGSRKAAVLYEKLLDEDPKNYEYYWLLNIAYMTLGEYPGGVPPRYLLPGMGGDTTVTIKPFEDIAASLKLDLNNLAGGSVVEDFDNDGYLDIVTSSWSLDQGMHYFKNNANGTFIETTPITGLTGLTGGLNIMQTDYNNDGFKDIFVLRGGWRGRYGREPNSLLKNNGDGSFTDVTIEAGLLSFHPTLTCNWNDFDGDGWLDLFIGNESTGDGDLEHPCELYMNNGDGTFREVAKKAKCDFRLVVKGVTSGDYDHDGLKDIFLSTMNGEHRLLKNAGMQNGEIAFDDVTVPAGLSRERGRTFPAWFWDYDNDGWLDIFVCDYTFDRSLAYYAAAEKLNIYMGRPKNMLLYHNNGNGTFTEVSREVGLTQTVFAMGSNFGDIDNDGYLDMYLGTGNPVYESIIPNKMFKNIGGQKFADVTSSARVGHLQKGHGVSFADVDNDGDQDIHIEMGGALPGDNYQNSFFMNPGQNDNRWINLQLEGRESNRAAIGTRVKVTFKENGVARSVYRDVNCGGSFGSSPLRREIGVGSATIIDEIEVSWHGSGQVQVFKDIAPNQFLKLAEGDKELTPVVLKRLNWVLPERLCLPGQIPLAMN
jgi:hypothetical protein